MMDILRSNHQRCPIQKGVLKNFTKFTVKHLCTVVLMASLKMVQKCFGMFQNVLIRCFNSQQWKFTKKICFNITWLGILNSEELKKVKLKVAA